MSGAHLIPKGVRVYTTLMPIRTASQSAEISPKTVVIDWSSTPVSTHLNEMEGEVEQLVNWVTNYPRRSAIHVVLRSTVNDRMARRLKSQLQSLGCRVTVRTALVSKARVEQQVEKPVEAGWNADFGVGAWRRTFPTLLPT